MRYRLALKIEYLTSCCGRRLPHAKGRHLAARWQIKQYQFNRMIDAHHRKCAGRYDRSKLCPRHGAEDYPVDIFPQGRRF